MSCSSPKNTLSQPEAPSSTLASFVPDGPQKILLPSHQVARAPTVPGLLHSTQPWVWPLPYTKWTMTRRCHAIYSNPDTRCFGVGSSLENAHESKGVLRSRGGADLNNPCPGRNDASLRRLAWVLLLPRCMAMLDFFLECFYLRSRADQQQTGAASDEDDVSQRSLCPRAWSRTQAAPTGRSR